MVDNLGNRVFYDFETNDQFTKKSTLIDEQQDYETLLSYINDNIIGSQAVFESPFGCRKAVYCDYTASGRSLQFIENFINEQVLPQYGSTHTTTSVSSLQTSLFRHEARDIIRNAVRASEHDRIIFVGSGSTSAVNKLIHVLRLSTPPIVFVDFAAHHSSLLPWREIGALVVRVRENAQGLLDMDHLESLLKEYSQSSIKGQRILIGCFTAASNITGLFLDDVSITVMLHQYGALAFWDYATAAPYVDINMNPNTLGESSSSVAHKDAIFFSLHKFIGGVQSPGVLIAKKEIFQNEVPSECGGGTVFFVSRERHRYLKDDEEREEGGTPPIVESIRGGLAMQLKMNVTPKIILTKCHQLIERINNFASTLPELIPLGNLSLASRIPILSFMVLHRPSGKFLHYNFISAVLNDLYGIQCRGGCACAGPYAQDLLGIDEDLALRYERILMENPSLDRSHLRRKEEHSNLGILRPGFVRLNFPFTASEDQISFIFSAIKSVCTNGWKLLPQYIFNPETGEWKHHSNLVFKNRQWLSNITYLGGKFNANLKNSPSEAPSYLDTLAQGEKIFTESKKAALRMKIADHCALFEKEAQTLRWFLLPSEARDVFLSGEQLNDEESSSLTNPSPPFSPVSYPLQQEILNSRPIYTFVNSTSVIRNVFAADDDNSDVQQNNIEFFRKRDEFNSCSLKENSFVDKNIQSRIHHLNNIAVSSNSENTEDSLDEAVFTKFSSLNLDKNISCEESNFSMSNSCTSKLNNDIQTSYGNQNGTKDSSSNKIVCKSSVIGENQGSICEYLKSREASNSKISPAVPHQSSIKKLKSRKSLWVSPPKSIFNPTLEALNDFRMIQNKDRVLVCLSGGKDSLSLLHTLRQFQFYSRARGVEFDLGAVTVDPQSSSYDPRPLIPYLRSLEVPYFYEEQGILKQAQNVEELNSICSFCSRMKRGRIYLAARREGYNVLAFGQHLDDLAESFLMSVFHNGRLRTMKASYLVQEGDLRVIRPFAYVREKQLRDFAESSQLPIIPENCPGCFEAPKERHRMKQLLAQQETLFPNLFWSLRTALHPLLAIDRTGVENELFSKKISMPTTLVDPTDTDDEN